MFHRCHVVTTSISGEKIKDDSSSRFLLSDFLVKLFFDLFTLLCCNLTFLHPTRLSLYIIQSCIDFALEFRIIVPCCVLFGKKASLVEMSEGKITGDPLLIEYFVH